MDTSKYALFASETLGVVFNDLQLLITAFTHRSYVNEHKKTVSEHNERLEFLGDAVLELVSTEFLYSSFNEPEGILTNWRSSLVRTESISAAASRFGFEPLLRLSRGEKRGTDRARAQILANCYEAVIGALYLDQGYDAAKDFIAKSILSTFDEILKTGSWVDPKSRYQEFIQSTEGFTPNYKVLSEEGPDHDKIFKVGVFVEGDLRGGGSGPSKQIAQIKAAEVALTRGLQSQSVDK
ncbi:ribonuclease III [bacterium]|nr:ribonuclease III [bacterium]NBX98604.1 ribonuclease III [bacterium]NDC94697.1 ribonuclease III [bacterium]NDD84227.1 ribonuclease III [bacterium]NDG30144.1 ribonuclease III [bacterium]